MAVQVLFCDSFGHYDTNSNLKWSVTGGAFETDPAHVRTGPQSLRVTFGDAPRITNLDYPVNTLAPNVVQPPRFVVGFAWQQSAALATDAICELWSLRDEDGALLGVPLRQFLLNQNPDGSLSIYTGNAPTLIGTTAAGVITAGPFWYIELTVNMLTAELFITVTDAANTAVQVLAASAFVTTLQYIDAFYVVGPVGVSAWLADCYFATWDGDDPGLVGAPNIYGVVVPISPDGFGRLNNSPDATPFNVSSPPYFSQVNELPQDTGTFLAREDVDGFFPFTLGQGFVYDISSIPEGSSVFAVQAAHMWSLGHDIDGNAPSPSPFVGPTGGGISDFVYASEKDPIVDSPFLFVCFAFQTNPLTGLPWSLDDFTGATAVQVGPGVQSSG